ncbi:MAG: bifunctional 2-C-methyl-D-erythritol 4-phosphate cytidylyltransferase/2-C-methyl-D-erythritol 2,4-cyclodiphosphate synthase [Sphingomonas fennica]
MDRTVTALIVAAGRGLRAGGEIPKQYRPIAGRSLLAHAVDALAAHPRIAAVQVVIGAGQEADYAAALAGRTLPPPVIGGAERRDSVIAGLAAVPPGLVLIHDAARPFVPHDAIDRLLDALATHDGAVPALPVVDTLALADGQLGDTVPREGLVRVQTPQGFDRDAILAAHRAWTGGPATDDAQVARAAGLAVAVVAGDPMLEKMTHPHDLAAAEARAAAALIPRTATGYDVHRLVPGDHVWLGGVRIPHDHGLSGHSDADVALHALTDALLGTIGAGDIGSHFPPSDPQWKGAASWRFLVHARDLVRAAGGIIDHVDVTIICEAPKVGPHRPAIRSRIAELLELREAQVSVKATTTEQLGFTGRREGIAAQASASVRAPL